MTDFTTVTLLLLAPVLVKDKLVWRYLVVPEDAGDDTIAEIALHADDDARAQVYRFNKPLCGKSHPVVGGIYTARDYGDGRFGGGAYVRRGPARVTGALQLAERAVRDVQIKARHLNSLAKLDLTALDPIKVLYHAASPSVRRAMLLRLVEYVTGGR